MQTKWEKNLRKDKKFEEIDTRLSVVKTLHARLFQKSSPLKVLDQWKPNFLFLELFIPQGFPCHVSVMCI
jgi:hypothetical protein